MASSTDYCVEKEIFKKFYGKLVAALPIRNIVYDLITAEIIIYSDIDIINSKANEKDKASYALGSITKSLEVGITQSFYALLDIMEKYGGDITTLANDIRKAVKDANNSSLSTSAPGPSTSTTSSITVVNATVDLCRQPLPFISGKRPADSESHIDTPEAKKQKPKPQSVQEPSHTPQNYLSIFNVDEHNSDNDRTVVIFGVTGTGKSSLGNFFFRQRIFEDQNGPMPGTEVSVAHRHCMRGTNVLFIDTVGFSDGSVSNEQHMHQFGEALLYARNGVHAIVVCLKGGQRQTLAEENLYRNLNLLGVFWQHAFVVYTHGINIHKVANKRRETVEGWLDDPRCPETLKRLFEKVEHRYITIECTSKNKKYYNRKVEEFLALLNKVCTKNKNAAYTNDLFMMAKISYDNAKKEAEENKNRLQVANEKVNELNESIKRITEQKEQKVKEAEKENEKLKNRIDQLNVELRAKQFIDKCLESNEQLLKQHEDDLARSESLRNALNSKLLQQREVMARFNEEISTLQNQAAIESSLVEELKEKLNNENINKSALNSVVDNLKTELTNVKDQLAQSKKELTDTKKHWEDTVMQLNVTNQDLTSKLDDKQKVLDETEAKLQEELGYTTYLSFLGYQFRGKSQKPTVN